MNKINNKTFFLVLSVLFTSLISVGAIFSVPLPPPLLPVTLAVFFCLLAGLVLGPWYGLLSTALYLLLGAIGLPVFANGSGGFGHFAGPSGGFLLGYALLTFVTGLLSKGAKKNIIKLLLASLGGVAALYVIGLPWFSFVMQSKNNKDLTIVAASIIMFPYLLGDIVKAIAAAFFARAIYPVLSHYKNEN